MTAISKRKPRVLIPEQAVSAASQAKHAKSQGKTTVEEGAASSDERYRFLAEHLEDLRCVHDMKGRITAANQAAACSLGYTRSELIGRNIRDILKENLKGRIGEYIRAIKRERRARGLIWTRTRSGEARLWQYENHLSTSRDGKTSVRVLAHDVTERWRIEKELRIRARQQAAVTEISQRALSGVDLAVLMQEATALAAETLHVDCCGVFESVQDADVLSIRAGYGWREGTVGSATVTAGTGSLAGYVLTQSQPVVVDDFSNEVRFRQSTIARDHGVTSAAGVLIKGQETVFGALVVYSMNRRTFTPDDLNFLQAAANVLATAIDRNRSEQALKIQALMLESLAEGVNLTDENGFLYYTNPAYDEMFGYARGEMVGKHVSILSPLSDEENALMVLQVVERLSKQGVWFGEIENKRKDGRPFTTYARVSSLKMFGRRYWVTVREDITHRKRAEEALRVSEERYRSLVENAPVWIHEMDLNGRLTSVNFTGLKMTGAEHESSVCGRQFVEFVTPDERHRIEGFLTRAFQGFPSEFEFWSASETEPRRVASLIVPIRGADGCVSKVVGISEDVTERRQAERALRQYADLLTILRDIDLAVLSAHSREEIAQAAVERVAGVVRCDRASVMVIDLGTNTAQYLAVWGAGKDSAGPGFRFPLKDYGSAALEALRRGESLRIEDVEEMDSSTVVIDRLRDLGLRSSVAVPLLFQGELLGAIGLSATTPGGFNTEHLEVTREIAHPLAVAFQQARLNEEVRIGRERLQTLSRKLMEVQEVERRHIARELHDEIGQVLTAVKISLQTIQRLPEASPVSSHLDESVNITSQALQQVRNLSLDLRPSMLDDLGLIAALRWYVDRVVRRTGLVAHFVSDPLSGRLAPEIENACFRIAQEALNNVAKHARATAVSVELRQTDHALALSVRDDGQGLDVIAARERATSGQSFGLLGMQERVLLVGGEIEITSAPGAGTEILARFPLRRDGDPHTDQMTAKWSSIE
ncbi:MAG TPA: PAS domain S-box protein [Blastocatellia bacterium]|nr:PAS domain S-box protein [Blastocatellia bacterium]